MPLSKNPTARARQLANLRQSNLRSDAAVTHGAQSEALIRPLAEAYLAELQQEFPTASERRLKIQARRLAKLERLGVYLDGKGEIRHQRRGEVYPASALEEKISAAFLAEADRLEAQQHEATVLNPAVELPRIMARLAAEREQKAAAQLEQTAGLDGSAEDVGASEDGGDH